MNWLFGGKSETEAEAEQVEQKNQKHKQIKERTSKSGHPLIYYEEIKYKKDASGNQVANEKDEAGAGEFYQLLAMGAGALCFFYRTKWSAWLCLFLFFTSIINFRFEHMV